jgi:hypothetical protein
MALIQRDDGALANGSVGLSQLSTAVTVGFTVPTAWATGTGYVSSPAATVFNGGKFYSCLVSHTSGTFATDLAAGNWVLIADLTAITLVAANQIAVTASGMLTTDVQGSLQALDAGKAATSHTHPSSAITDSTAAGRAMLSAANLAAQHTLLGLGAQAYVNNAVVTSIGAQLAFTGVISPAALVASANDWGPTGWATASRVRLSATSAINITGMLATTDGDIKIIENIGATYAITITHDDTASAAGNRVTAPSNFILDAGQACILVYGATSARWRIIASGILPATSAQATALSDGGVAITPATASAVVATYNVANATALQTTFNLFLHQLLQVREEQAQNTASTGSYTAGAYRTIVLNTVKTNEIVGAALASNQVTGLPAGTYFVTAPFRFQGANVLSATRPIQHHRQRRVDYRRIGNVPERAIKLNDAGKHVVWALYNFWNKNH